MDKKETSLFVIPTPIGNLDDITLRAVNIFKQVDLIVAEDTRTTGNLLKHLKIQKPLKSYHIHNEHKTVLSLVELMIEGQTLGLTSDAGTPGISDPGYLLIRETLKNGLNVECLPGPTAFVPALVNSGIACDRFLFEGFLPHKKGRLTRLKNLLEEERTMVFYESPHRIIKTLEQFSELFGSERNAAVSRELTKIYEETIRGTLAEILTYYQNNPTKGEFVITLSGKPNERKSKNRIEA